MDQAGHRHAVHALRARLECMDQTLRPATPADIEAIECLLPRLADFDVPAHRRPEDLWQGDRDLVREWASGRRDDMLMIVAARGDEIHAVVGASLRAEWLTGVPSAHVELLVVDPAMERQGIGAALLHALEVAAIARGATSLSLNVFTNNRRARALYERAGFHGELMRYFKPL